MFFEGVRIGTPGLGTGKVDYMVNQRKGVHDRNIANFLAVASGWAYAHIDTFARQMATHGGVRQHETVCVTNTNPELFLDTTFYLLQSADGRLAILSFRGTVIKNITTYLTDASARAEPFMAAGRVHGGFYRAAMLMWPTIQRLLDYARSGYSICAGAVREKMKVRDCMTETGSRGAGNRSSTEGEGAPDIFSHLLKLPPENAPDKLEALYITGHSLGGALAVLTAALLQVDPAAARLRCKLRGVYTYGQPMVGDKDFADRFQREFGDMLFRHVYREDVIPRLPPRTMGRFAHFGDEFGSSDEGWVYRSKAVSQTLTAVGSAILSVSAFFQAQFVGIPIIQRLPLPFSLADHQPINYMSTSQIALPGSELT